MNAPQLPTELILAILAHLAPSPSPSSSNSNSNLNTLHALTLTSSLFHTLTTPLLYHSMTSPNPSDHLLFLTTLTTTTTPTHTPPLSPLAPLVRIYHLPSQIQKLLWLHTTREHLWKSLHHALPAMTNLQELLIPNEIPTSSAHRLLPALTRFPAPFALEKLVWGVESGKGSIQSVLDAQPRLRYFKWTSPSSSIFSQPTGGGGGGGCSFPHTLTCLGGTTEFLIHVLPHTPAVRHVSWNTMQTREEAWLSLSVLVSPQHQHRNRHGRLVRMEGFKRLWTLRMEGGSEQGALCDMYDMYEYMLLGSGGSGGGGGGEGIARGVSDVQVLVFPGYNPLRDPSLLACFPRLQELIISKPLNTCHHHM